MGQGRDIVEWAKDYRLAYPDATANMLEDMAEHRDRAMRRAIQNGVFFGVGNLGIALAMIAAWQLNVMESLIWPAMLFAVYGLVGLSRAVWKWLRWRRMTGHVFQATSQDPPNR
jgi:hypothetical protein